MGKSNVTNDGGYVLRFGYTNSGISGDVDQNNRGVPHAFWIVKIDAQGNFGTVCLEVMTVKRGDVIQKTNGRFLLIGKTGSQVNGTARIRPILESMILDERSSGSSRFKSMKTFGTSETDTGRSIFQGPDGEIVWLENHGPRKIQIFGGSANWMPTATATTSHPIRMGYTSMVDYGRIKDVQDSIITVTGELTFAGGDYDNPQDADQDNTYEFEPSGY